MESKKQTSPFLEEVRQLMRVQHYANRTEQSYIEWIKRFILSHGKRHPKEMGEKEVAAFLTHSSLYLRRYRTLFFDYPGLRFTSSGLLSLPPLINIQDVWYAVFASLQGYKTCIHYVHLDNVKTTEIYTHVIGRGGSAVISPLETIFGVSNPHKKKKED